MDLFNVIRYKSLYTYHRDILILFLSTLLQSNDIILLINISIMAPTPSSSQQAKKKPSASALVPQWVAQQFYRHGLFCSSHVSIYIVKTVTMMV